MCARTLFATKSEEKTSSASKPSERADRKEVKQTSQTAPCPVCGQSISCNSMNEHLDLCLMRDSRKSTLRRIKSDASSQQAISATTPAAKKSKLTPESSNVAEQPVHSASESCAINEVQSSETVTTLDNILPPDFSK